MKRNDIRVRKDVFSRSSMNRFKDFDRVSREYRRRQLRTKARNIAVMVITGLVLLLAIIYGLKI